MAACCCRYTDANHRVAVDFEAVGLKAGLFPASAVAVAGIADGYPYGYHTLMAAYCACHHDDLQICCPCPDSCHAVVGAEAEAEGWTAADSSACCCQTGLVQA